MGNSARHFSFLIRLATRDAGTTAETAGKLNRQPPRKTLLTDISEALRR